MWGVAASQHAGVQLARLEILSHRVVVCGETMGESQMLPRVAGNTPILATQRMPPSVPDVPPRLPGDTLLLARLKTSRPTRHSRPAEFGSAYAVTDEKGMPSRPIAARRYGLCIVIRRACAFWRESLLGVTQLGLAAPRPVARKTAGFAKLKRNCGLAHGVDYNNDNRVV